MAEIISTETSGFNNVTGEKLPPGRAVLGLGLDGRQAVKVYNDKNRLIYEWPPKPSQQEISAADKALIDQAKAPLQLIDQLNSIRYNIRDFFKSFAASQKNHFNALSIDDEQKKCSVWKNAILLRPLRQIYNRKSLDLYSRLDDLKKSIEKLSDAEPMKKEATNFT